MTEIRPAIGTSVRLLCAILALACVSLAVWTAAEGDGWVAVVPLALATMFAGPALFATGPPTSDDAASWARRRYLRVRRVELLAGVAGFAGIGVAYVLGRVATFTSWLAAIQATSGCLLGLSTVLEFGVAYYRHYVRETARDAKTAKLL